MDTVHSEKAPSPRWVMDAVTLVVVAASWGWIVFDLGTGRHRLGFLDGIWLCLGPVLLWRYCSRLVVAWKARRVEA
jgi:hypothetical protein